ncbi:MAG: AsmA family protein [Verrucomicrobiales bacterium]|nr:AsmA family protein [Verrucomicrobiales bacterium]
MLFALFLGVFAVVYVHEIGVPGFVKRPLLKKLQQAGFNVQFSNARWSWPNHLHIENPAFAETNDSSLHITGGTVDVSLDLSSAAKKQLRLESFSFTDGRLVLPISETNNETLILTNVQAAIRLSANNTLRIDKLGAQFDGANVQLDGILTNCTAALDWELFKARKGTTNKPNTSFVRQFSETWAKLKFTKAPDLAIKFSGDAADPDGIKAAVNLIAKARTETPWGAADNLQLRGNYDKQTTIAGKQVAVLAGSADYLETSYGTGRKLDVGITLFSETTNLWRTEIVLESKNLQANWTNSSATNSIGGTDVRWKGHVLCTSGLKMQSAAGKLQLLSAETTWGRAQQLNADLKIVRIANSVPADTKWDFWKPFVYWKADWDIDLRNVTTPKLAMQHLHCTGDWKAPQLSISKLESELYDGSVKLNGEVNVATRDANAKMISDLDPQKIASLLPQSGQRWLKKFTWEKAPHISTEARVTLPAQINSKTDWKTEVLPTLYLTGKLALEAGSYQTVSVLTTQTEFVYSNMTWRIPNLHITRPEGVVDLNLNFDKRTGENHWIVDSSIDPKALRPLFPEAAQATFDKVLIGGPPVIHADIFEHDFDFANCGLTANVLATNLAYREIKLDRLKTFLTFSNSVLSFFDTEAEDGAKEVRCGNAEIDFNTAKVSLHEVYSTMEPMPITRAIGRKVAAAIEPYQFHKTPTVYVEGSFVFDHPETGDMHFIVEGEEFEWGVLKATKANGKVDWIGTNLYITNIVANAYRGGEFEGWVAVNIRPHSGNDFQIAITFTNADLQMGLSSLGKTNRLEGTLNGKVNLTAANTQDRDHWEGFGWMQLQNGFIWEVPVFGIFSPVLNTIAPGTGNSRAGEASASFLMTNSLIRSDDLEIRSPAVRINYRGTVDFNQQVDAIVEAQVLRDAGSLGHLFSIAMQPLTKLFEYKLTGSLEDPKSEPVFIPKILLNLLRPFHSLKRILPDKSGAASETAPPTVEVKTEP